MDQEPTRSRILAYWLNTRHWTAVATWIIPNLAIAVCLTSIATAQGPGLYKDGVRIMDFNETASAIPARSKSAPENSALLAGARQSLATIMTGAELYSAPNLYLLEIARFGDWVRGLSQRPGAQFLSGNELGELHTFEQTIHELGQKFGERLDQTATALKYGNYPQDKQSRHAQLAARSLTQMRELESLVQQASSAATQPDWSAFRAALQGLNQYFAANEIRPALPQFNSGPSPVLMERRLPPWLSQNDEPRVVQSSPKDAAVTAAPGPGDLLETVDIEFTPEITALAADLHHSPVEIFSYVRNQCAFEAYLGSRKGSQQTLDHRRGNDYDLASLLLALLRISGIPSRYARGFVEIPMPQIRSWIGIDDASTAATLLHTAGFEVTMMGSPPDPSALRLRRVWVEAYMPYLNYRGSLNDSSGYMWVPMDPAFAQYSVDSAVNMLGVIALNSEQLVSEYCGATQTLTPIERLRELLLDSLAVYYPGNTFESMLRTRTVIATTDGILPGTLPYELVSRDTVFSEIPDNLRYKVRFRLYQGATTYINYQANIPAIARKQVTISYAGATPADQQIIDTAGGVFHVSAPYLVDVLPILRIDGCEVARGTTPIVMGTTHNSDLQFTAPVGLSNQVPLVSNVITAGNSQGIGIDTEDAYPAVMGSPVTSCAEDNLHQVLHQAALSYLNSVDKAGDFAADMMHIVVTNDVSEAIVENTVRVLFSGGQPITFEWTGMTVDADRKIVGPYSYDGSDHVKDYMRVAGADGSYQENRVFETVFSEEAVSTIKILQLANETGIPVFDLTPALIPQLTQPPSVIASVQAALAIGHHVVIPRDPLTYFEWTGTGWIDMDTATCAAGYLISGGQSGGATVQLWTVTFPDMLCMLPIGPVEVTPASASDLYCAESTEKWIFTIPTLEYWGKDKNGKCKQLGAERKDFPVKYTIKQIAEMWGPGKYTFRAGAPNDCGCTEIQKDVTIVKVDLAIHYARVVAPGQTEIPEEKEMSVGAQTFVNLDNDDRDTLFDNADSEVGDEDEMCKITLRLTPKELNSGTVKLDFIAGGTSVKIWTRDTKETAFDMKQPIAVPGGFTVFGNSLEKDLWVEGISPSVAPCQTQLKMTYSRLPDCPDKVAMTVIGIDKIEWVGQGNGLNDDDVLDADPNWPGPLAPGSDRVFPGAHIVGGTVESTPRNQVNVRVTLTCKPSEPIDLHFKSFDVDDPTSDTIPLEHDFEIDNRNLGEPAGLFPGGTNETLEQSFNAQVVTFPFEVSMFPGDNYRIAGNGDQDFIADMENNDPKLGDNNADLQRITNKSITTGTPINQEIREANHYASKTLTVWRKLHIEFDSMGEIASNFLGGLINSLDATGTNTATTILYLQDTIRDGSLDLDINPAAPSPFTGNGRFEQGTLRIANTHNISPIDGNGAIRFERAAGLNVCATPIPFTAKDYHWFANSTMSGTVTAITNSGVRLALNITARSQNPLHWAHFIGGTVRIGGGAAMRITAVDSINNRVTVDTLKIPYRASDDDMADGTDIPDPDLSIVATAFAPAYVLPVQDAGNHQGNLVFRANLGSDVADSCRVGWQFDLAGQEANPDCWIIYVRGAFQHTYDSDGDPNDEGGTLGIVDNLWPNGQGANIFMEVFHGGDALVPDPAKGKNEAYSVAHEIGHLLGGRHDDCIAPATGDTCVSAGLMAQTWRREIPTFSPVTLNRIRNAAHP